MEESKSKYAFDIVTNRSKVGAAFGGLMCYQAHLSLLHSMIEVLHEWHREVRGTSYIRGLGIS